MDDNLFTTICERIADGESLRSILREPGMPCNRAFYAALDSNPDFRERYAHAKERQADALADEILDVSRSASNETYQPDRLLVDALKWRAAKLKPKVYGDKQDINLTGQVEIATAIAAARKRAGG